MSDNFDFDSLERISILVRYDGKEYTLREANGGAAKVFHNARLACIKRIGPDGKPQEFANVGSLEPLLVSLCLYDAKGKRVPQSAVEEFPARVQKQLYDKALEISCLEEKAKPDAATLLRAALLLPDSPCTLAAMREFVQTLDETYEPLKDAFKPTPEEQAKNLPSATAAGSE